MSVNWRMCSAGGGGGAHLAPKSSSYRRHLRGVAVQRGSADPLCSGGRRYESEGQQHGALSNRLQVRTPVWPTHRMCTGVQERCSLALQAAAESRSDHAGGNVQRRPLSSESFS